MKDLCTADRALAALTDERGNADHLRDLYEFVPENADRLDAFEFGVLVGVAYALERAADPFAPHDYVLTCTATESVSAWRRYTTPGAEVK